MMKKILVVLALAGIGAAIALGARDDFPERDDAGMAVPAAPVEVLEDAPVVEPAVSATPDSAPVEPRDDSESSPVSVAPVESVEPAEAVAPAREAVRRPAEREAPAATRQEPDAAAVLRRAAAAYEALGSLQANFEQRVRNPLIRSDITSRGTLYQRRPDRFLMRFSDPAGDVIVSDGRHFWVYYPSVDKGQVHRMPAGAGGVSVDLQAQFLGDPHERFTAELLGREAVRGRDAHVLLLTPLQDVGYQRLKAWVDVEDALVRRFEITERDGRVRHFELFDLVIDPALADSLFRFTPPEGARIVDRG